MILAPTLLKLLVRNLAEVQLHPASDHDRAAVIEVIEIAQALSPDVEPVGVVAQRFGRSNLDRVVVAHGVVGRVSALLRLARRSQGRPESLRLRGGNRLSVFGSRSPLTRNGRGIFVTLALGNRGGHATRRPGSGSRGDHRTAGYSGRASRRRTRLHCQLLAFKDEITIANTVELEEVLLRHAVFGGDIRQDIAALNDIDGGSVGGSGSSRCTRNRWGRWS